MVANLDQLIRAASQGRRGFTIVDSTLVSLQNWVSRRLGSFRLAENTLVRHLD